MKLKLVLGCLLLACPLLLGLAPGFQGEACDPASTCFDTRLIPDSLVGDFYLDGALVAAGVNGLRLIGTPSTPHLIEVRNIQEPGAADFNDLYNYPDQSVTQQANPGWIWLVHFYPVKNYLKGPLIYFCDPLGRQATDAIACRPTIDGVTQPDVAPGTSVTYNLTAGPHAIHTDLVGDQAVNWSSTARDDSVTITAGLRAIRLRASFSLKGLLRLSLAPAGTVADFYVDGALVAPQSATAELFVAPAVAHVVEAKNVVDPAANGRYAYGDVTQSAIVYPGRTRNVYLRPVKTWLMGTLSFFCQVNRWTPADDVQCLVSADGAQIGTVPAGTRAAFDLPTGSHALAVATTGASAERWDGPVARTLTIFGGRTAYYTARFNLRPAAVVPPPVSVPPPVFSDGAPGGFELGGQVGTFSAPDLMRYAGMAWVKRQVLWSPGLAADAWMINDAHAKGFKILLSVIGMSPDVISGGNNYDAYAAYVGQLARLGADGIEVWNEMNIDREWPTGQLDPARYTDLLRLAYFQIKANNPNTLVISGAPAPTGAEGAFGRARVWNDDAYIAGMAAAGAANYMDCIGAHYNEGILSPTQSSGDPRDPYYTRYYSGMVSTYFNAFGGARKICFTELGYLSPEGYGWLPPAFGWAGNTTVAQQAQWLAEAVSLARSSGSVRMIIVFNVDFTLYGDDPQGGYAIIRPGGGCPACDSLRAVTGGR